MKTNYTATLGFTIIKPKGKKARREQRKAWKLFRRTTTQAKVFQIRFYQDGRFRVATGTLAELRPIVKALGKYRMPGDRALIHHGKAKR